MYMFIVWKQLHTSHTVMIFHNSEKYVDIKYGYGN